MNEYLCEVCGMKVNLTEQQAFDSGWDYPPFIGIWGVVGPRTCGVCNIQQTAWWAVAVEKKTFAQLSEEKRGTILRILAEVPIDTEPPAV